MDFVIPADLEALRLRVREFIRREVMPLEPREQEDGLPDDLLAGLRDKGRQAGLWLPHLPAELGGLGLGTMGLCLVFEEAGYSPLGPYALHCAAPDEGNMHLLHRAASAAQKRKYLEPLARGDIRSCFALTEPAPGAGADPTMIRTRAERRAGGWVINGHKWFTSGAMGSAFAIVAALTDPQNPRAGVTLFLVEAGTPGFEVVRAIPTMGAGGPGGHCEITLRDC